VPQYRRMFLAKDDDIYDTRASCTRNCAFCAVAHNGPTPLDDGEPRRVAEAAEKLKLNYVVITSVTRDDLPDGGAEHFARTINAVRSKDPEIKIEVLVPDFKGNADALRTVADASPDVINHNLETIKRLYPDIRPQADYKRSLNLLKEAKNQNTRLYTKSGIMLGLGETKDEVISLMNDLRDVNCDILTIGQYIRPSKDQALVVEYIEPGVFSEYEDLGKSIGFKRVFSGPFVRSSYKAGEIYEF